MDDSTDTGATDITESNVLTDIGAAGTTATNATATDTAATDTTARHSVTRLPPRTRPKHRRRRDHRSATIPWPLVAGGIAAIIVASALAGAALRGGRPTTPGVSAAAVTLASRAATAWVDGTAFSGARAPGVPADLGRSGPATRGVVEAVGSTTAAGITSQLFVVAPPSGPAFGLSVVIAAGRVAYPVTVSPLPFATSIPVGTRRVVPESGRTVAPAAAAQAREWAGAVFGSSGQPAGPLGYAVDGAVTVLGEWIPATGAAFVIRVRVPLSGPGPSTAPSPAVVTDRRTVADDARTVAAVMVTVAADEATLTADGNKLGKAVAAAQKAAAGAVAATPAHPRRAARDAAEAAAAQIAAASDRGALAAAQTAEAMDQSMLADATRSSAAAAASLSAAEKAMWSAVTSVYDVAYDTHGQPVAWAPADYLIGAAA